MPFLTKLEKKTEEVAKKGLEIGVRSAKKDSPIKWKCRNCGYVYEDSEAPEKCSVCEHAKGYFEVWCENY